MVAYSFQTRFAPDIQAGLKTHTIRGERKRHARPGEALQLYCKMRHPDCFKIIPDPVCRFVDPILLVFSEARIEGIWFGAPKSRGSWRVGRPDRIDRFARLDGFQDAGEMHAFWYPDLKAQNPLVSFQRFPGFIIGWGMHPLASLYQ